MSLNWEMPDEFFKNYEHLMWRKHDDDTSSVQPELESFIWSTMLIQHDTDGEMTDEKLTEIYRRIELLNGNDSLPTWSVWDDEVMDKPYRGTVNLETVIRYWGLQTNVPHKNAKEWDKYFLKISKPDQYTIKSVLDKAKEAATDTTKTQPERILKELVDKAKKEKEAPLPPTA